MKLGHVHLKVRDLQRSISFYERYLGMQVTERLGESFVFLTEGERHHDLALQEVGAQAGTPDRRDVGLYHVAFEAPDRRTLATTYRRLVEDGVAVHPVDHRISLALYFYDPDGNGLEVYWDTRESERGAKFWEGRDRPFETSLLDA